MSEKYLIFGATGSIGSNLSKQLKEAGHDIHLIARNETEVKKLSSDIGCTYSVADVLEDGFIDKVKRDIEEIKGIAYCVGSIDLKPLKIVKESDFHQCMKLNLYSAVECIKKIIRILLLKAGTVLGGIGTCFGQLVGAQKGYLCKSLNNCIS